MTAVHINNLHTNKSMLPPLGYVILDTCFGLLWIPMPVFLGLPKYLQPKLVFKAYFSSVLCDILVTASKLLAVAYWWQLASC